MRNMSATAVRRGPAQTFALAMGVVYLLIGVLGFFVTGFDNIAGRTYSDELLIFSLNPLHNLVHLALGAAWLWGSRTRALARTVNLGIGAVLGLVTVLGALGALRFLAIEDLGAPDNFLHLITAALALYFASAGAESS
ncbi:MAG: DUF4383 domain-containing protein [Actinomycetota bacterium]